MIRDLLLGFTWIMVLVGTVFAGDPRGRPNSRQPGPWDNDVLVYRVAPDGTADQLATFERAGVPTLTRLNDGRLIAAFQHFPQADDARFDKVAVRFSSDEGVTWTEPETIRLTGLPAGMRSPFDPTLVALPDERVRLYFTSRRGRRFDEDLPAIYSAISANGVDYAWEPGTRFGIEGRPVIDCAVALHRGVFHLYAPDNGTSLDPGQGPGDPSRVGVGYHATSDDGLNFTRQADVRLDGGGRFLGNALSAGEEIVFFGTGTPGLHGQPGGGIWMASSKDGQDWKLAQDSFPIRGADPAATRLRDGGWLLAATGTPRPGSPSAAQQRRPDGFAPRPLGPQPEA
ncbi:MAG: exo-alpha-sialidase, partial [Candidatus Sumerlaeota bacterium]|nr:exo-alpha-sialidase [Candidatus Sumerlaeota bacterium]